MNVSIFVSAFLSVAIVAAILGTALSAVPGIGSQRQGKIAIASTGPVVQDSPSPAFTPFPQVTFHPPISSPDAATATPEAEPSSTATP
jgi:hypothetical protein